MPVFILDNLKRVGKVLEDNAFFFGFFNFHHVGRHFILGSSVNIVNFLGSQSYSRSARVHSGISAAHYGNLFAKLYILVSYYLSQEVYTSDNALSVLALASYSR